MIQLFCFIKFGVNYYYSKITITIIINLNIWADGERLTTPGRI